jgi:hypothetical protein
MDWMTIVSAIAMGVMVAFLIPVAKRMHENSRKAEKGEWMGVLLPIAIVVLFIVLLVKMV